MSFNLFQDPGLLSTNRDSTGSGGYVASTLIASSYTAVLGGQCHVNSAGYSTVPMGRCNSILGATPSTGSCYNTILNGLSSQIQGCFHSVYGGSFNYICNGHHSAIAMGDNNVVRNNDVTGFNGIENGQNNLIEADGTNAFNSIVNGYKNEICNGSSFSGIAFGGRNCIVHGYGDFIGAGVCNFITTNSVHYMSAIAGGCCNFIADSYDFVGAGRFNSVCGMASSVVGGQLNKIDTNSVYSFIGGGSENKIKPGHQFGLIGGGLCNCLDAHTIVSFIGGGQCNAISGDVSNVTDYSVIGGGLCNIIGDPTGSVGMANHRHFIGGGILNCIHGLENNAIAGGCANHIEISVHSAIVAGLCNCIRGAVSAGSFDGSAFIGAGCTNTVKASFSSISSGCCNYIENNDQASFIGAGYCNRFLCSGCGNFIGSGCENTFGCETIHSSIGGGYRNRIDYGGAGSPRLCFGFIGGGSNNILLTPGYCGPTIGGGDSNIVSACFGGVFSGQSNRVLDNSCHSNIGGGFSNSVQPNAHCNFIGGGSFNNIFPSTKNASIVGGCQNQVQNNFSFIGGGASNTSSGSYSSILGGSGNNDGGLNNVHIIGSAITAAIPNAVHVNGVWADSIPFAPFGAGVATNQFYYDSIGNITGACCVLLIK